jgi:hypothetical protein
MLSLGSGVYYGVPGSWTRQPNRDERNANMDRKPNPVTRYAALGAIVLGLGAGSYGLASAANGSGSSTGSIAAARPATGSATAPAQGWGSQRSDETPLTGEALAKVTAVAKDALPGATIVRVETDADGIAKYEAHVVKADGTLATVYVDAGFELVSVGTGGPGRTGGPPTSSSSATA